MKIIEGDLIQMALTGEFDFISHGTNCFCVQKAGIAKFMSETFRTNELKFEHDSQKGQFNKLGIVDFDTRWIHKINMQVLTQKEYEACKHKAYFPVAIGNSYSQYEPGPNLDMIALLMCFRKIAHFAKGTRIGLPLIGGGIGGGDPKTIISYMKKAFKDEDATLVLLPEDYQKYKDE